MYILLSTEVRVVIVSNRGQNSYVKKVLLRNVQRTRVCVITGDSLMVSSRTICGTVSLKVSFPVKAGIFRKIALLKGDRECGYRHSSPSWNVPTPIYAMALVASQSRSSAVSG